MKIFFITSNPGKVREVANFLGTFGIEIVQLKHEYPEIQAEKLEDVVDFGISWLKGKVPEPFMIEDSGLFIESLKGFPGVYSSYVYRTIGLEGILKLMEGAEDRRAYFKSVIGFYIDGKAYKFSGVTWGRISNEKRGTHGFGYDPIFIPEGSEKTFAEMTIEEKNALSHRGKALKAFFEWLKVNLKY
ncbi:XTP/dITP diphosphatase [Pyrococcus horikoshii]|uniref:dITP/XTP pyrophosphatase n=2 Tax=Pyrococcus horikoshii TaxID=53953 RepID=IXTPA_PYRHO|nr:XTP/dITP diphosphatase [Pyrococcus horikoshii]O59580.1 RecName: Full=dITP/XTP pyrophosphatase; AltName: Full=Non-canonical purine NTP pyrophosphatase; AltName: Full=Non-standard purine NTP pyrophosphatase; AltName: Full=Nucleoside-triphosphate diphosphatase; AltName: Full=Nucleoside-triphosphate pyrophosphatase; Short=NTPase [Pyrococcus horikoshii OT3]1V7R_A Chain A, Structure of nucleotide triphosphate pyrophosphatase from pyrococcus horikoshii OT3 [Pyrococcus horikoshii OT3]2DVN_A Chain A, 